MENNFKPLTSTNGQNQYVLAALLILGAIFGVTEETINTLYMASVPIIMGLVEVWKKIQSEKPRWNWNIISYVGVAVVTAVPGLAGVWAEFETVAEWVRDNGFGYALIGVVFPLINQILAYLRSKENNPALG